jgi:hypothetical protein
VIYHNRFARARGWVRSSVAYSVRVGDGADRTLVQKTLGEGLGLHQDPAYFCIFRDHITGLEYIRRSWELCEQGLYAELEAYKCHVFVDWREVQDNEWHQYAHLADYLNGRGVPSIEEALREVFLRPIHGPFRELVNAETLRRLIESRVIEPDGQIDADLLDDIERRALALLHEARQFSAGPDDETGRAEGIAREIRLELEAILQLPVLADRFPLPRSRKYRTAVSMVQSRLGDDPAAWSSLLGWLFTHALGRVVDGEGTPSLVSAGQSRSWMDEWLLGKLLAGAFQDLGLDEDAAWWAVGVVKILISHQRWYQVEASKKEQPYQILVSWLRDGEIQRALQVNRYGSVLWFNHEAFDQLLGWMLTLAAVEISADPDLSPDEVAQKIVACYDVVKKLQQAEAASEYQVVKLMEATKG